LITGRSQRPLYRGREKTGVQISAELFVLSLQEGVIFIFSLDISLHHGDKIFLIRIFKHQQTLLLLLHASKLYYSIVTSIVIYNS